MGNLLEKIVTAMLALSAMVVAVSVAHQSFSAQGRGQVIDRPMIQIEAWQRVHDIGIVLEDSPDADLTLTTLADLECPACAAFHRNVLEPLLEAGEYDFDLVFVHHPLSYHNNALPAARAAECAAEFGAFKDWVSTMYSGQDSLGVKSWGTYAAEAGIPDTTRIADCAESSAYPQRVQAGLDFGEEVDLFGTPTVLINGWRFGTVPSRAELEAAMTAILAGERPEAARNTGFLGFFKMMFT